MHGRVGVHRGRHADRAKALENVFSSTFRNLEFGLRFIGAKLANQTDYATIKGDTRMVVDQQSEAWSHKSIALLLPGLGTYARLEVRAERYGAELSERSCPVSR